MKNLAAQTPRLAVRMACGLYESLLVFGVLAGASLLYAVLVKPSGEENWGSTYSALMLVVLAGYFTWFWSKGETLAMATWHLRLHQRGTQKPPGRLRSLLRFAISLLWFLPGLAAAQLVGMVGHERWWAVLANVAAYAAITRLHPSRQYLHDVLAGTEMVRLARTIKKKS